MPYALPLRQPDYENSKATHMASTKVRVTLKAALILCVAAAFWNGGCSTAGPVPPPGIQGAPAAVAFHDTMGAAGPRPAASAPRSTSAAGQAVGYRSRSATRWLRRR